MQAQDIISRAELIAQYIHAQNEVKRFFVQGETNALR